MNLRLEKVVGVSGLGESVSKLIDASTNEELGYMGTLKGKEVVHFVKPIPLSYFVHITKFVESLSNITNKPNNPLIRGKISY